MFASKIFKTICNEKMNVVAKSHTDLSETYFVFFKILSTIHPIMYPIANTGTANTNAKTIAAATKIGNDEFGGAI